MAAENFPSRGFRPTSQFAIRQPFLRSNNKSVRATSSVQNFVSRSRYYLVIVVMQFRQCRVNAAERTAQKEIRDFDRSLSYFESRKVSKGIETLPDGFTHSPVFLIRNLLRVLPAYYVAQTISRVDDESGYMAPEIFCKIMAASYVGKRDLKLTPARNSQIKKFQECYLRLVASLGGPFDAALKTLQERSAVINHRHRITGDAVAFIIEEVIAMKGRIKIDGLQEAFDAFIDSQVLIPGKWHPIPPEQLTSNTLKSRLLQKIHENLEEYKESI